LVLTICRHSAATPLVGRPTPVSLSLLSLASRAPAARPSPLGWCRAARSARTRLPARGVRVCASRAHALTPFASLILSPPFEAIHFLNPFGRRGLLSFPTMMRRFSRTRREGLCVSRITPFASFRFSFRAPFTCHFLNPEYLLANWDFDSWLKDCGVKRHLAGSSFGSILQWSSRPSMRPGVACTRCILESCCADLRLPRNSTPNARLSFEVARPPFLIFYFGF